MFDRPEAIVSRRCGFKKGPSVCRELLAEARSCIQKTIWLRQVPLALLRLPVAIADTSTSRCSRRAAGRHAMVIPQRLLVRADDDPTLFSRSVAESTQSLDLPASGKELRVCGQRWRVATSSSIQSNKSVSMNPNCRPGFILEDTFNSDHNTRFSQLL